MFRNFSKTVFGLLRLTWFLSIVSMMAMSAAVDYDIVHVRAPRFGDKTNSFWPKVFHPARLDPGADLMLLRPDGSEEVLVAGGLGSTTSPFVSSDGPGCYCAYFPTEFVGLDDFLTLA